MKQEADWTLFIYGNGNNELEPEMRQAMLDAEKVGSCSHVHVVMQIGRADYELVQLLRQNVPQKDEDRWSGVRRYLIGKGHSELLEELGLVNMADPKQLYNFLKWGMVSYPAKRYLLILGGHSYHCVGMMTDYSKDAPYIMGIPELARVINMAANEMGSKIDLLLLDTCCSNSLELIYEFGREVDHAVCNVMTYMGNGPIEGLPYDRIIHLVVSNHNAEKATVLIKNIIETLSYPLISFEIDHKKLRQIKQLFHDKAFEYRSKHTEERKEVPTTELKKIIQTISKQSPPMFIYHKRGLLGPVSLFTVTSSFHGNKELMEHYDRLAFAQDNDWVRLIQGSPQNREIGKESQVCLLPLRMSPQEVFEGISVMNPERGEKQKREMLKNLYEYKNWTQ